MSSNRLFPFFLLPLLASCGTVPAELRDARTPAEVGQRIHEICRAVPGTAEEQRLGVAA